MADTMQETRPMKTLAGSPAFGAGSGVDFWVFAWGPLNPPPTAEGIEIGFAQIGGGPNAGRELLVQLREGYESEEQQGKWIWETRFTIPDQPQPVTFPVPPQNAVYIENWSDLALRVVLTA